MFTVMDLTIKALLQTYGLMQVTFFNSLFALIALIIWIFPNADCLKTSRPKLHFFRAFAIVCADLLAFYAFGKAEVAEVYTLLLTMPIFTAIFAILFSVEKFNAFRILCSFLGFGGALLVLVPEYSHFNIALFAALGCAMIEALCFLAISHLRHQESPESYVFYSLLLLCLITGSLMMIDFKEPEIKDVGLSVFGGISYALGTVFVTTAFIHGVPSKVSSMQYSQLVWGMLLAFIIWNEIPDTYAILGGIIVMIAGLALILQKAKFNQ